MMTAIKIEKELKEFTNSATITRRQLAQAMGKKSVNSVSKYVDGLQKFGDSYFIKDVAEQVFRYGAM